MSSSHLPFELEDARIFAEVAAAGSLTLAAKKIRIPKSTLSRRLSKLEDDLRVTLIRRSTRRLALTEAGQLFLQKIQLGLRNFEEASTTLSQNSASSLAGTIRFTTPVNLASEALSNLITRFQAEHPLIRIELLLTDRVLDFVGDRIDVALRAGISPAHSRSDQLMIKRITQDEFTLVANPKAKNPILKAAITTALKPNENPTTLPRSLLLDFAPEDESNPWTLSNGSKKCTLLPEGKIRCDSLPMLRHLTLAGAGIAFLPESLCAQDLREGRLVRLHPQWSGETTSMYLVHHRDKQLPARVRAFLTALERELKTTP